MFAVVKINEMIRTLPARKGLVKCLLFLFFESFGLVVLSRELVLKHAILPSFLYGITMTCT